jgi:hypothetical protein
MNLCIGFSIAGLFKFGLSFVWQDSITRFPPRYAMHITALKVEPGLQHNRLREPGQPSGKADVDRTLRRDLIDRSRAEQKRSDRFGRFGVR